MSSRLFLLFGIANVLAQSVQVLVDQTRQYVLNPQKPDFLPVGQLRRFDVKEPEVLNHVLKLAEVLAQPYLVRPYLIHDRKMT